MGPPFVGVPSYVEIVMQGLIAAAGSNTVRTANVWHYRKSVAGVLVNKTGLDAAFRASLLPASVVARLNSRWSGVAITYRWLDDSNDAPQSFPLVATGGIVTDSLPTDNAVTIQLNSNQRGKSGRGSKHYGPVSESDTTGDVLTGGALTAWQAIRDLHPALFADAAGNTWVPCIISRQQNGFPVGQYLTNPTTVVSYDVTAAKLNATLGTMRRRKVRTVLG